MRRLFFILVAIVSFTTVSLSQDKYDVITAHPRVILSKEADLSLQFLFLENEDASKIQSSLKTSADQLLEKDQIKISTIKEFINKGNYQELFYEVSTLSLAFRLFEDEKYSDKVTEYLVAISSLDNWSTNDLVDISEITKINALGYDWLFYVLNRSDRELIRNAIVQKGLEPSLAALSENPDTLSVVQRLSVTSGLVLGGLAVADDFPALNKKVIYRYLMTNQTYLESLSFASIIESSELSWYKIATDLAMVLSSLNISLGHDFKITSLENIKSFSSDYFAYLENDLQSDEVRKQYILNPAILWFGKLNRNLGVSEFYIENVRKYHFEASQKTPLNYVCLLWMI